MSKKANKIVEEDCWVLPGADVSTAHNASSCPYMYEDPSWFRKAFQTPLDHWSSSSRERFRQLKVKMLLVAEGSTTSETLNK